jgi:aerobic carbon-monoxide dehydrogenase medium subunit
MKPPPFEYHAPSTVEEAVRLLDELEEEDAKVLAGGQSLVPMMNLRLARPGHLIDINRIDGLDGIHRAGDEWHIGARTRHVEIEDSEALVQSLPLFPAVASQIGYRQIRCRGTVGGSLCHADPVAEWPMIMLLMGAELEVAGPSGKRRIRADDFFEHLFTTTLAANELLENVRVKEPAGRWGWGFVEFARKVGDFAVVAAGVIVEADDGAITRGRIAIAGGAPVPLRSEGAETSLAGAALDDASAIRRAAEAAAESCEPSTDVHGTAEFRRHLVRVQTERALTDACRRASQAAP